MQLSCAIAVCCGVLTLTPVPLIMCPTDPLCRPRFAPQITHDGKHQECEMHGGDKVLRSAAGLRAIPQPQDCA